MRILVLRPEPGASETAARARKLGLEPVVAPLFTVRALPWEAPDPTAFDAVLLTSANAARHGGDELARLTVLPCYAVGEATAQAARAAGFENVAAGAADGLKRVLHLCGRDHVALAAAGVSVQRRIVYAADAVEVLPPEAAGDAVAMLHSPRAGRMFAALVPDRSRVSIAAISANAAEAAGEGWRRKAVAAEPRDQALLELAARLCNIASPDTTGADR